MESRNPTPYYAVNVTTSSLMDDVMFRVMAEKIIELASEQEGYLETEWVVEECCSISFYWRTKEQAQAWMDHTMMQKILSIGQQCWFDRYSLKLMEVQKEKIAMTPTDKRREGRFPYIKTARGVLKVLDLEDMPLLHTYVNEQREFLAPWEPQRHEDYYSEQTCLLRIKEMRREFLEDKSCVLCLLNADETRMLAYSNYSQLVRGISQSCFLGYSLAQDCQGQSYMHECLEAGIKFVSEVLNIDRIQACYMPRNQRSGAVLERLGFEREGMARDYLKINGVWEDHILTALILR